MADVRALIAALMEGVRIIVCPRCHGLGKVGLASLQAACPQCRGCGETTVNTLEVEHGR